MKTKLITLFLVATFLIAGCGTVATSNSQPLTASGMIEATEIAVAPALSGRVVSVSVTTGASVKKKDVLFRLDDTLLQTQNQAASAALALAQAGVQSAQSGVAAAQAQYDLTLSNAVANAQPYRIDTWTETKPGDFEQPLWYFSTEERFRSTQTAIDEARKSLEQAQANLDDIEKKVGSEKFLDAEQRLSDARVSYQVAQDVFNQAKGASDGQKLNDVAKNTFEDAKTELDHAQQAYNDTLTTSGAQDVLEARAKVRVAQENYDEAADALRAMQTGANSLEVLAASKVVDQARAGLVQAQAAVDQAKAQLAMVEAQMTELTIYAPLDGVVLTSSVEVGEVLQAGATALTIGELDKLKVTVYIPEIHYGEVNLGEQASLTTDSFPDETFIATVVRIADQAEFTPQNVQTTEGRQTTVYAVELSVENSASKLKPGMPVDVTFNN